MVVARQRGILVAGLAGVVLVLLALVLRSSSARRSAGGDDAAPRVPTDPGEVLARVPSRARDPRARELAELRKRLSTEPRQVAVAVPIAEREIALSRSTADPRHLGRAQAALAPWWDELEPPPPVLLLRATIRQSLHEFDPALRDLDRLVSRVPGDAQAWITRATVLTVLGQYERARQSCAALEPLVDGDVVLGCRAPIDSLTGHAGAATKALVEAADAAGRAPERRAWLLSLAGEASSRAGDDRAAEAHFREALRLDPEDRYTRAVLADLLLDLDRAAEVLPLLDGREEDDALLLRLALSASRTGDPRASSWRERLDARYRASMQRGDVVHRREQARFALAVGAVPRALELAQANWQVQREPADARVLLEAALAAGDPSAAAGVIRFVRDSGAEEPRLRALVAQADGAGPR